MNTQGPKPRDSVITPEECAIDEGRQVWDGLGRLVGLVALVLVVASAHFLFDGERTTAALFVDIFPALGISDWARQRITKLKRSRLSLVGTAKRYANALAAKLKAEWEEWREAERAREEAERAQRAREEAERARHRRRIDYWMVLGGRELEREVAILYAHRGYQVEIDSHFGGPRD